MDGALYQSSDIFNSALYQADSSLLKENAVGLSVVWWGQQCTGHHKELEYHDNLVSLVYNSLQSMYEYNKFWASMQSSFKSFVTGYE